MATIRRVNGKVTREYAAWKAMKARCYAPCINQVRGYQQKGIYVCEDWLNNYEQFLADMGSKPSDKHSLDRIDNDGPYSKENCRWATDSEQTKNRGSFNKVFIYNGKAQVLKDWARELQIKYTTLWLRIYRKGLSFEDAIVYDETVYIEYQGQRKSIDEWVEITGIPKSVIYDRNHRKWAPERIFTTKVVSKYNK